jgi:hypothetical protein
MKKHLRTLFFGVLVGLLIYFGLVGIETKYRHFVTKFRSTVSTIEKSTDPGWQLKEPSASAEFISGPLAASVGELCVFRLNDSCTKADWTIVPSATCYIDSSGSSLAFASNVSAKYTIIAAIVEDGVPKILTHICEYGNSPEPSPSPTPTPKPEPPPTNLTEWVTKNIPEGGQNQCAALASCYEAAADGIDKGSIKTPEAAFSAIRTATQTKIKSDIWGSFLDQLAVKVTEKVDGSNDVRKLGAIFSEIASGLKAVSDTGDAPEERTPEVFKLPSMPPATNFVSPPNVGTDPIGKPTTNSRGRR